MALGQSFPPTCVTYLADDMAFVGDAIFMPDFGTARVDFPGGDAGVLYDSIRRILALPPKTRIFVGHDYGSDGRPFAWESSVAEQRSENKHVRDGIEKDDFIKLRHQRDKELTLPMLLLAAMQVNIRGGELPAAESSGNANLKIPLNVF